MLVKLDLPVKEMILVQEQISNTKMIEKHLYSTNFEFDSMRYKLKNLKTELLNYFNNPDNAAKVAIHTDDGQIKTYDFNYHGISIHIKASSTEPMQSKLRFLDIILISQITPTSELEKIIQKLGNKHKVKLPKQETR